MQKNNNKETKQCTLHGVRHSFSKNDMEICWNNARSKRFDTGVTTHNDFDSWYKKYLKDTKQ